MLRVLVIAFVCLVSTVAFAHAALSIEDQDELRTVVREIRQAILNENINDIIKHLNPDTGLPCTDTLIAYQEVVAGLHNKESYIYLGLFNTSKWRQRCGDHYPGKYPAISEKEFFQGTHEENVEYDEIEAGWVKVTFRSNNKTIYPRYWIFQKVENTWKLADGFIVSRCSCG